MKAKELRIGNYINAWLIDGSWQVIKVDSGKKLDFIYMQESNNIYKPIPITEDWLVKLGFESNGSYYQIEGMNIWKLNDMYICDKNGTVLYTIHQLQNLYFALTRKELTI